MNHLGQIVAHTVKKSDIINFGVVVEQEKRNDWRWLKIKWTNREFKPNSYIETDTTWIRHDNVELIEPFGLISDLHLAMIEQVKEHFGTDDNAQEE